MDAFDVRQNEGAPAASLGHQARLLARFARWVPRSPRVVHYCVARSPAGLARDVVYIAALCVAGRRTIAHVQGVAEEARYWRAGQRLIGRLTCERVVPARRSGAALTRLGVAAEHIPNPVRIRPRHRHPPARRNGAAPLHLLFAGRYGASKGCYELVAALARARSYGADAVLRFVGCEERRGEEARLRAHVAERGVDDSVLFEPAASAERLGELYSASDVVCLLSHSEGMPMAILEGMAFGLVPLATRVGGIPELVEDERSGLLVEPRDVEGCARAIVRLAREPELAARLGAEAAARVTQLADNDAIAARWSALYDRCRAL